MVEALSSRFQNYYNKHTRSEIDNNTSQDNSLYLVPSNNTVKNERQHLLLKHNIHQKSRSRAYKIDARRLCQPKDVPWEIIRHTKTRPFTGQCCSVCIPYMLTGSSKVVSNLKNVLDIYNIRPIKKSIFGHFFDHLKFFYFVKNQEYSYVYDEVLEDENVIKAIEMAAREACNKNPTDDEDRFNEEIKIQQKNAICILTVMSAKVKNWVYKVVAWFTSRMVSLLATSVVVQPSQIERVREAEQSGIPVIYLPLHKSHMDYILLGLVLTMHNIKPPLVAAGENLRIFFISELLSYLGAFYIKRRVDTKSDQLYWSVLSSYIKNSLKKGHHLEFFLEGARTRSGKCCVPKGGLLSIIVDAYREGVIEDAWIIPTTMNYDQILEGDFVREQLGQPKKKETFFSAISTFIKAICSHYGIMRVDFNNPYRLRDLYESIDKKFMEVTPENIRYKQTIDGMAKHIVYDCWASTPIMSTYAVSFLLLRKYRNGATLEQLAIDLSIMRNKMQQADKDIGFSGSSKNVVEHALNLLFPKLVKYEKSDAGIVVKPILDVPNLIELSYYANGLLSHYFHQSIVALSLCKMVSAEFWNMTINETLISRKKLKECVQFITELLQFDFVFYKPCQDLDEIIDTVIRKFELDEIIVTDTLLEEEKRSQNLAKHLDNDDSDDDYPQSSFNNYDVFYRVSADKYSLDKIKYYRSIMMPYLECMAECAGSFVALESNSVPEREHVQTILNQMHENLEEGVLCYGESISIDTIKHSFLAFEKYDCLTITEKDNVKTLSMVNNQFDAMQNMSEYIELFVKQIN